MKLFHCQCGQQVYFENTQCMACQRLLGFDPGQRQLLAFDTDNDGHWRSQNGLTYKLCRNGREYGVCNWVLPSEDPNDYCLACSLNEMVPAITAPKKRHWWGNMESAKRRLIFTLLQLNLPVLNRQQDPQGLAFAFLEDQRMNPSVKEEFVETGHAQGLITVNLAEADDASREHTRITMGERYRTLLGHFRHESGHYYFDRLLRPSPLIEEYRQLFGDERQDYKAALKRYYQTPPPPAWETGFISDYAQSHPMEDWAECWAHYLHMVDTLETAAEFGLVQSDPFHDPIENWLHQWDGVTTMLNSLNRSMGLRDAYPFTLSATSLQKIRFVHRVLGPT